MSKENEVKMETGITNMGRASTVKITTNKTKTSAPKNAMAATLKKYKNNNFNIFIENIQNSLNTI
jgi:hypothetical protein